MTLLVLAIMLGFGGATGIIGWCLGCNHTARKVRSWMAPKDDGEHRYGRLGIRGQTAARDRRLNIIEHRSRLT